MLIHDLAHPGRRATSRVLRQRYVWPSIGKDSVSWTKSCIACQRSKIQRHTKTPLMNFPDEPSRFGHIHIDLVGPLPPARGFCYLLTIVDRFTRWIEAIPLSDISAETVADAFVMNWVARYGTPSAITSDQGRQFESQLFQALTRILGAKKYRTTAFHPSSNGMVERVHRQLKAALKCHETTSWIDALPIVLLGIRSAYKEHLGASSAELVFGTPLRLPGEFLTPQTDAKNPSDFVQNLRQSMSSLRPTPGSKHGTITPFFHQDLKDCSHVFLRDDTIRKPLQQPYTGPYNIIRRGNKTFLISVKGKEKWVSADRLKPAYLCNDTDSETTLSSTKANPPKSQVVGFEPKAEQKRYDLRRRGNTVAVSTFNDFN